MLLLNIEDVSVGVNWGALFIVALAMFLFIAAYRIFLTPYSPLTNLDDFSPTDTASCQRAHRHLWELVGHFPESVEDGTFACNEIYACPVCTQSEGNGAGLRCDTIANGRHKDTA